MAMRIMSDGPSKGDETVYAKTKRRTQLSARRFGLWLALWPSLLRDETLPLSLNDDEFAAVQAAAAPIHPLQRGAFLKALADELGRHPVVGPGLVHRLAADLQRRYVVEAQRETSLAAVARHLGQAGG
jgi:hypothetical protein